MLLAQRVQSFSQTPREKFITRIMTPAKPYSSVAGRKTVVGHFATHSPHPVHRPRCRTPPSDPGGATAVEGTRACVVKRRARVDMYKSFSVQ